MGERITLRLPDLGWAECARADLESEGLEVRLAARPDADGLWALEIGGCAEKLGAIRAALIPLPAAFDWGSWVNAWLSAR